MKKVISIDLKMNTKQIQIKIPKPPYSLLKRIYAFQNNDACFFIDIRNIFCAQS